ncbi:hypothetical protein HF576_16435 [Microbacterium sp. CFH 90308]|uniref:Uncharacterized protein n=1 Tax=Microbacterium salsuginis TaxID=2722803 RepID=A0ABX1KEG0_9MICO|nr:hypothetical protein [Microbacterium sp. CFH 90308]NLP85436.1 hypothetical protein [Microbacterium sp. CFH 90308]
MTDDKPNRRGPLDRAESIKWPANRSRELKPTAAEIDLQRAQAALAKLFTAIENYNQFAEKAGQALTREDIKGMTPEEVDAAYDAGDLDQALGRITPADQELVDRATNSQTITYTEAKRLHEMGHSELVANLPITNITKDGKD